MEKKLTYMERKWMEHWKEGMCNFLTGGSEENEMDICMGMLKKRDKELRRDAIRWETHLIDAFKPIEKVNIKEEHRIEGEQYIKGKLRTVEKPHIVEKPYIIEKPQHVGMKRYIERKKYVRRRYRQ